MRAVSRLPTSIVWQRATLVRNFVELLSSAEPAADVWRDCCRQLALLVDARSVTIAVRDATGDRILCRVVDGSAADAPGAAIAANSVAAQVLSANTTVVRTTAPGCAAVGVPIRFGSQVLGAICIDDAPAPDAELIALLESCGLSAGARMHSDAMLETSERYERLAGTDALTGIANRRQFDERLAIEWARAVRTGTPLTLLMIDVDHFKLYNDTYGHPAGDACLQHVARAVADVASAANGLGARYGGEEFAVLVPGLDLAAGTRIGEALKADVAARAIEHSRSSIGFVSVSIGAASAVPPADGKAQSLLFAADAALYEAKREGRNCVHAAGYTPPRDVEPAVIRHVAPLTNVPRQTTQLIGRVREVGEITALLTSGSLVTITACGGAGKTRISLAIATGIAANFPDGTWFIDLARVNDGGLIAGTIGALFNLEISAGEQAAALLARALAGKRALLVFDNCEHVLAATAAIAAALIDACAGVRILATSREALGIRGEAVYALPLLAVPPSDAALDAAAAARYDAVALFVERARAVKGDFCLTDVNAPTIAAICRQLDGIALAIELAAARVNLISVGEILKRLDARFRLLRGNDRSVLPRQQTMRALIDWSYDMLSPEEQLVFRRMSVFAGGWTFAALSAICTGEDFFEEDVFDMLDSLVRKSLVVITTNDSSSRYRFLQSVRDYALEKLAADADRDDLHRRHAAYYCTIAETSKATYYTTASKAWMLDIEPELENFRAAMHWSLECGNDVQTGAALAGSLVLFLAQISTEECLRWLRMALDRLPPDSAPAVEAALWYGVGRASENLPAHEMRAAAERALALARLVDNPVLLGDALRQLILVLGWYYPDEAPLTSRLAQEAIASARTLGDPIAIALALRSSSVTLDNADVAQKQALLEESLTLLLKHGNDYQTAVAFMWLAENDFCLCGGLKASTYALEAMRFAEESGSASILAQMATNLAQYTAAEGNWNAARRAAADAAAAAAQLGMDGQVTWAVQALAIVSAGIGDYLTAARLLGFCQSRAGTLHSQRQANGTEEILYLRLRATLDEHLDRAVLEAAMLGGAGLSEKDALQAGLTVPEQR